MDRRSFFRHLGALSAAVTALVSVKPSPPLEAHEIHWTPFRPHGATFWLRDAREPHVAAIYREHLHREPSREEITSWLGKPTPEHMRISRDGGHTWNSLTINGEGFIIP